MPRSSQPNYRIYHDMCIGLDIVELARRGFTEPGTRCGRAELLASGGACGGFSAEIRSCFGGNEGLLRLHYPEEVEIRARPVDTAIGRRWRLACPECGGLVKRLYLPESPPKITPWWACRHCWNLRYRPGGRGRGLRSIRERLAQVQRMKADLAAIERSMLLELAELSARGPAHPARTSYAGGRWTVRADRTEPRAP